MKPLTLCIALVHILYIIGVMWLGPVLIYMFYNPCNQMKLIGSYMVVIMIQFMHWRAKSMNHECILSLWEKRSEEPTYVAGSEPEKTYAWILMQKALPCTTIMGLREFHMYISKLSLLLAIYMITAGNTCLKTNHTGLLYIIWIISSYYANRFICFDSALCSN